MDKFDMAVAGARAAVAEQARAEAEAASQFTLGRLIKELEAIPDDAQIGLGNAHSYRGYYEQLAFTPCPLRAVAEAVAEAKAAMGQCFTGYKGGEFWMTGNTMVWLASYGSCGDRIVGLSVRDGVVGIVTAPDD